MKFLDPHIHMTSRTTDDYQRMSEAGCVAVIEPAFWMGQPRKHLGTFDDYFSSLVGWERFRAKQFSIHHFCTIGLTPKEANNDALADDVLELMHRYLEKDGVVGVGEIGFDDQTAAEERVFIAQLELAREYELPVMIHTPHRDKKRGTDRSMDVVTDVGIDPGLVLIDHNTEETVKDTLDRGYWAGHSVYPETKMDESRMAELVVQYGSERILVNSAADWGVSDPLKVPKSAKKMQERGISEDVIETIIWRNPIEFFSQSGRLDLAMDDGSPNRDQRELWQGNSVLRGQSPVVDEPS